MVTYFNKKDLGSVATYLFSPKREENVRQAFEARVSDGVNSPKTVEEALKTYSNADFENWMEEVRRQK